MHNLDAITYFIRKTAIGIRVYEKRKEIIERPSTEAKVNHGLRFARAYGVRNMREYCLVESAPSFDSFMRIGRAAIRRYTKSSLA